MVTSACHLSTPGIISPSSWLMGQVMGVTLKNDPAHPGGGFALIEGPGLSGVQAISIENCVSSRFLNQDGEWTKFPYAFPVTVTEGGLLLGPQIVDNIPTELQIRLRSDTGIEIGKIFWADIIPSRNSGPATRLQFHVDKQDGLVLQTPDDQAIEQMIPDAAPLVVNKIALQALEIQASADARIGEIVENKDESLALGHDVSTDAQLQRKNAVMLGFIILFLILATVVILFSPSMLSTQADKPPSPAVRVLPSFDCVRANLSAEIAICSDDQLSSLDAELGNTYKSKLLEKRGNARQNLVASERAWIADRNKCGADKACLSSKIYSRLRALSN